MMNQDTNRRKFLQQTTETTALVGAATALGGVHVFAEEKPTKIRLGIIGCGGMMGAHVKGLVDRSEAVSIASFCDVDPAQIEKINEHVTREFQTAPPTTIAGLALHPRGPLIRIAFM